MLAFKFGSSFHRNYSTILTLVRHAQSIGNAKLPITCDYWEYPITDFGHLQVRKFASIYGTPEYLKEITSQINSNENAHFDPTNISDFAPNLVISSPFVRALETSIYLLNKYKNLNYQIDVRLSAFTYLDSKYYTKLRYNRKDAIESYWNQMDPEFVSDDQSESFKAFYERTLSFFRSMLEMNVDQRNDGNKYRLVVGFTHAMSCRMLILLRNGQLPCFPKKIINDSSELLKRLNEREKGVSIEEAKEAMIAYRDCRKQTSIHNCEFASCLL